MAVGGTPKYVVCCGREGSVQAVRAELKKKRCSGCMAKILTSLPYSYGT